MKLMLQGKHAGKSIIVMKTSVVKSNHHLTALTVLQMARQSQSGKKKVQDESAY